MKTFVVTSKIYGEIFSTESQTELMPRMWVSLLPLLLRRITPMSLGTIDVIITITVFHQQFYDFYMLYHIRSKDFKYTKIMEFNFFYISVLQCS